MIESQRFLEGKMEELVEKSKGTVIEKYNDDEK
jgi:hypothetical protein